MACFFSSSVPGRTLSSIRLCRSSTVGGPSFDNLHQVTASPKVVALAIDVITRGLPFLGENLLLLLPDPRQLGKREDADGVEFHPARSRDSHSTGRRIHAQMDILNVLEHDVSHYVSKPDLCRQQYSFCALMITKIRSTSSSVWRTPYKARLDDLLFCLDSSPTVWPLLFDRFVDPEGELFIPTQVVEEHRLPGVSSVSGVSSAWPASTFFARSAIRFRYSSYSMALAFHLLK